MPWMTSALRHRIAWGRSKSPTPSRTLYDLRRSTRSGLRARTLTRVKTPVVVNTTEDAWSWTRDCTVCRSMPGLPKSRTGNKRRMSPANNPAIRPVDQITTETH